MFTPEVTAAAIVGSFVLGCAPSPWLQAACFTGSMARTIAASAGPFERLAPEQFTALLRALVGLCALDAIAGVWLRNGRRRGALLGLATEPAALVLGSGFALPVLLVGIPVRVVLLLAGRRSHR